MSHNLRSNFLTVNLVRHAQSTNNALEASLRKTNFTFQEFWKHYEEQRSHDPALSETGIAQASILADHLKTVALNRPLRLFCSPLHRSIHTAQILAEPLGAVPELWVDIFEEGGMYQESDPSVRAGKTTAEIEALGVKVPSDFSKGVIAQATDAGWWNHPKETPEESQARAKSVVNKLIELASLYASQKMNLWLVAHGDFLCLLLKVLLKIEPSLPHNDLYFYHDNCGVTQFNINADGEVKMNFINRNIIPFSEATTITDSPEHTAPPPRSDVL